MSDLALVTQAVDAKLSQDSSRQSYDLQRKNAQKRLVAGLCPYPLEELKHFLRLLAMIREDRGGEREVSYGEGKGIEFRHFWFYSFTSCLISHRNCQMTHFLRKMC